MINLLYVVMPKRKTTIVLDEEVWREWMLFVVDKTGSARKLSEEVGKALKEYMEKRKSGGEDDLLCVGLSEREWELLNLCFKMLEIDAGSVSESFREFLPYALYAIIELKEAKSKHEFLSALAELSRKYGVS